MSKIILKNVRLSFPSLFHKAVFDGKETKFEATFLIDKATQADKIKEIKAAIDNAIKDALKGGKLPPDKVCMKDGDNIDYAGYAGMQSLKASSSKRPIIIDRDKSPLTEDDNKFYAGCYVNASLELWVQNNQFGKRVNCNLLGIQFFKDGEPFADGVKGSVDDFEAFGDDEETNDFL